MIQLVSLMLIVLTEKEWEINKTKDNHNKEMQEVIEESRKSFELTKQQRVNEEVTKIEYDYIQKVEERDRMYNDLLMKFNSKNDSWKLEKRVIGILNYSI